MQNNGRARKISVTTNNFLICNILTLLLARTLDKKTVHSQESRGCDDIFIWFGGPRYKRFQGPVMCSLVPPLNNRLLLAIMAIKPVALGSYRIKPEPEFKYVTRRLERYLFAKRYLFRGQAAQQGFQLFSFRVVHKIYIVHFHTATIKR